MTNKSHIFLLTGFILFAALSLLLHGTESSPGLVQPKPLPSPDTVIPKGFVLVPIELANAESLSSLISDFAIVDLYRSSARLGRGQGIRVGHQLRLLRAPLNPKTFAVLVPDSEARGLVASDSPLIAVLQNNQQTGMGSLEKPSKKSRHIEYYSDYK